MGEQRKNQKIFPLALKIVRANKNTHFKKPNDDYAVIDNLNQIFILTDGVSQKIKKGGYIKPSPAFLISRLFSQTVREELRKSIKKIDPQPAIIDAIIAANDKIKTFNIKNRKRLLRLDDPLAGTVGIVSLIKDNFLYYSYVGDCNGFIIKNGELRRFTRNQTQKLFLAQRKKGIYLSKQYIHNDIRNNIRHPLGYGVFNGDRNVIPFLVSGKMLLTGNERIILTSDGLNKFLKIKKHKTKLAKVNNPKILVEQSEKFERKMKLTSDDKSLIIITLRVREE